MIEGQSDWRFGVSHDGTIMRGRAYRLPSEWTDDAWRNYWDGDGMVCFVDYGRGVDTVTSGDWTERALTAYRYSGEDALQKTAPRLTGNPDSVFVHVSLDRGWDCYALAWSAENQTDWRNEIEAVWRGDLWRIEVEEYQPGQGPGGSDWVTAEDVPEEYYGEEQALAGLAREFSLAEVPEQMLVTSDN